MQTTDDDDDDDDLFRGAFHPIAESCKILQQLKKQIQDPRLKNLSQLVGVNIKKYLKPSIYHLPHC